MDNKVKKTKRTTFTDEEKDLLFGLILEQQEIIGNKVTAAKTVMDKKKAWQSILSEFNMNTSVPATLKQIQNQYYAKVGEVRKNVAEDRAEVRKTGGGEYKVRESDQEFYEALVKPTVCPMHNIDSCSEIFPVRKNVQIGDVINLTSDEEDSEVATGSAVKRKKCVSPVSQENSKKRVRRSYEGDTDMESDEDLSDEHLLDESSSHNSSSDVSSSNNSSSDVSSSHNSSSDVPSSHNSSSDKSSSDNF